MAREQPHPLSLAALTRADCLYSSSQVQSNASQEQSDSLKEKSFDNLLSGYVKIKNLGNLYEIGGNAKLDIENVRGNAVHYFELSAFAEYKMGKISFSGVAGLQLGGA